MLLVLALILAVVVVIVDRVAVGVAERRVAELLAAEAGRHDAVPASTDVQISGFPFLNQVAAGRFDGGHVVFNDIKTKTLTVQAVDVNVAGLVVPRDVISGAAPHDVVAERVRGTATVTLAEVARGIKLQGLALSGSGDTVRFSAPIPLPGLAVAASGSAKVRLRGNRVWLEILDLKAGGVSVPKRALDLVATPLTTGATLPPLPLGLRVTDIKLAGTVVKVSAAADNVDLAGRPPR
jgi:hypothetical protein